MLLTLPGAFSASFRHGRVLETLAARADGWVGKLPHAI
jgi:hypothetical protein